MKTKVAFVGPIEIHNALASMDDNWDFQSPVQTLEDFEQAINSGENDVIADDTSIIILFGALYQENPEHFVSIAAYLAPYSAMIILGSKTDEIDGEDAKIYEVDEIREAIKSQQIALHDDPDNEYDLNTPFYFMDYEEPQSTLADALSNYVSSPLAEESARNNILSSLPDQVIEKLQADAEAEAQFASNDDYSYDDDDTVVIPAAAQGAMGKVFTVTSSKGGSGKSTVSMLLGTYLAKGSEKAYNEGKMARPLKVLIFDFDTRDGQLGFLNGVQSPTIIDIMAGGEVTSESIRKGVWHSDNIGCDFIFSTKRPRYASQIPNEFFAEVIQKLRETYDYIILDTSVNYLDPLLDSVAYPIADQIVFVTDVGISSIFGMVRWLQETTMSEDETHENIDPNKIGIVVNKVLKNANMGLDKIQGAVGNREIYAMLPSMPDLITYAANTSTLDQVLNQPVINNAIYNLASTLISPQDYDLAKLPVIE